MRIAIMTDSYRPTVDGVVTAVLVTKKALEDLGHTVFVIAPDPGPEYREEGVYYFRAVRFRTYPGYFVPCFPSDQSDLIRRLDPDVIHVRGVAFMAIKALIASHNTKVPVVLTYDTLVTDVIDRYSPIKLPKETLVRLASVYLRQMMKRPAAILVPTPSAGREVIETIGVKPKRMEVVPTGIDNARFTRRPEAGEAVRRRYGLEGRRIVITVGRVSFEKNVDLVIRSLKLLEDDIVLMVVGQGPALDGLRRLVEEERLQDRVVFTGYQKGDDLVDHYSCADAFVSASVFETQGFTVQEAMSCGLPVACGNGRAFTDFIRDGENGYLFGLTEEECARAIMEALDSPQAVRDRGMETALSYGLGPTTERLVQVYGEVIEENRKRRDKERRSSM